MQTQQWHVDIQAMQLLSLKSVELPQIKANEVLIQVNAVALNYRDKLAIDQQVQNQDQHTFVLGSDMSGTIIQIGDAVKKFKLADDVINSFSIDWDAGEFHTTVDRMQNSFGNPELDGVLSEYIVLPEHCLSLKPQHLSFAEASTLTCAATTAWEALITQGQLKAGETVVIQGTGGVAIFALQIALAHGAQCIVISGDDQKIQQLQHLGHFHSINRHTTPDWHHEVLKLTKNTGAQHILELVGGDNLARSLEAIAHHGKIYMIGVLQGIEAKINVLRLLQKHPKIIGIGVAPKQTLDHVTHAIDHLKLKPIIAQSYAFNELPLALAHLKQGALGKIVIDFQKK